MNMDDNSAAIISKLLNKVLDSNRGVKVYEEVAISGNKHYLMSSVESRQHFEEIKESESPLDKMFRLNPQYNKKDFSIAHEQINNDLIERKKNLVSRKQMSESFNNQGIFKKVAGVFKDFISNNDDNLIKLDSVQVNQISNQAIKSRNKELVENYLLINNQDYQNPSISLLAKGIKNIENPTGHPLMPKNVIQEVGVLQIGMALNEIATKPIDRSLSDKRRQHYISIKRLAQSSNTNKAEFLNFCKQVARVWEDKHKTKLLDILENHNEQEKIRKENELAQKELGTNDLSKIKPITNEDLTSKKQNTRQRIKRK